MVCTHLVKLERLMKAFPEKSPPIDISAYSSFTELLQSRDNTVALIADFLLHLAETLSEEHHVTALIFVEQLTDQLEEVGFLDLHVTHTLT